MKATEIIAELADFIRIYGDHDVEVHGVTVESVVYRYAHAGDTAFRLVQKGGQ